jgi:hypothetical protein
MSKEPGIRDVWIFFVIGIPAVLFLFGLVSVFVGTMVGGYDAYRTSRGYDYITLGIIVFAVELAIYAYLRSRGRVG